MQRHHDQPTTTVAVLGADTVVRRAPSLLLEGYGYRTGVLDELLEGADLLLLAPRLDEGVREAFLGATGKSRAPQTGKHAGDRALHGRGGGLARERGSR